MFLEKDKNALGERLSEIADELEAAVAAGDLGAIGNCVVKLRDLRLSLKTADGGDVRLALGKRQESKTPAKKPYVPIILRDDEPDEEE